MTLRPINLAEYEVQAQQVLEPMALDYYASGAEDEITLHRNCHAYRELQLRPRVGVDVSQRSLVTCVLGDRIDLPILVAPMAFQCLAHPEGELATAMAVTRLGTKMVLSTLSTKTLEAVVGVHKPQRPWFQLYIHRDRALTEQLIQRANVAGYSALCVTVDAPLLGKREVDQRNQFILPRGLELANLVTLDNLNIPKTAGKSGLWQYFAEQIDPSVTWKDVEWLRSQTTLPIVVKGVLRGDDAQKAINHGATGIVVSNHGGRQLDGAIASITALPEVVAAVGDQVEIFVDGGIRRGTDILKALALGATAVMVGRPILWGLAVAGAAGAQHVLELLRAELDLAMALSGCSSIDDIDASLVHHSFG